MRQLLMLRSKSKMADHNTPVLGNYRRYAGPSLGEFDVNTMMEKATTLSLNELKQLEGRTAGKDSCVVNMSTSSDDINSIKMFRQRGQVETGGKQLL